MADLGEGPGDPHHPFFVYKIEARSAEAPPLAPSECLDPPMSVVSVVVSMIIFQTIFSGTSLLQTKQTCYLIETLGKSSTYSLLEGENPFLFGSAYSIYRRYLLWLQGGETRSVYLNDLIKKKNPCLSS